MSNIEQTIARFEVELAKHEQRELKARARLGLILESYEKRGEDTVTDVDKTRIDSCFKEINDSRADQQRMRNRLDEAERIQAEERQIDASASDIHSTQPRKISDHDREYRADGAAEHAGSLKNGDRVASLYGASVQRDESSEWRYSDTGRVAALRSDQRFADHEAVREYASRQAESDRIVTGMHGNLAQQVRALTTSGASAVVPTEWSFPIIDKARNASVMMQAGCTVVPMPAKTVQIGRLTTDPTAAFKTEGSAVSASDPAFDYVQLVATSLTALTVASLEFLQDAPNASQILSDAISKSMALELDKAIMFGQLGATGTNDEGSAYGLASPYPKGILKNLVDNASSQIVGAFPTNGTAQTAATPWNELIALYYAVKTKNETPKVIVSNDKLVQQYVGMYDTTYQPLRKPELISSLPWLTSNVIPSYTRGTMASRATDVFAGDFSQVLVGQRLGMEIRVLTERYAENGQVGILSYWRGDVQVARPNALAVYRALQGAA